MDYDQMREQAHRLEHQQYRISELERVVSKLDAERSRASTYNRKVSEHAHRIASTTAAVVGGALGGYFALDYGLSKGWAIFVGLVIFGIVAACINQDAPQPPQG